jgi:hypothetical protein
MRRLRSIVPRLGPRDGSLQVGLLIGMTLSAVVTGAQAETIYSTGFEPPDYFVGPITAQQGWFPTDFSAGIAGAVETGTVFAGVQAVGFDSTGETASNGSLREGVGMPTAGQGSLAELSDEFFVSAVNGLVAWDALSAFGSAGLFSESLGQIEVNNGIATLQIANSSFGAVPVSIGAWHNYTMDFNFATGVESAFVDGALIGTSAIAVASTAVGIIQIGIDSANDSTAQGFWDNVLLSSTAPAPSTSVPEPSTWAMLLAGFAALGFLGFRRTRSRHVAA